MVKIAKFWNFIGVDWKFLNFGIKIEKALKFYGLKMHFSQINNIFFFFKELKTRANRSPLPMRSKREVGSLPHFPCFCFRFCLDSSSAQSPLPLWPSTPLQCSFSSLIFWFWWFLQRFLDQLFLKQIYVFAAGPSLICVIILSSQCQLVL